MDKVNLTVDEGDFSKFFKEAGRFPPEKGDVLAVFKACAELVDGQVKREVIRSLKEIQGGSRFAVQMLMKQCKMTYREAIKITKEICADLQDMNDEEVLDKPYNFVYENKYFVKKEFVPTDSPHWEIVSLKNVTVSEKMPEDNVEKLEVK